MSSVLFAGVGHSLVLFTKRHIGTLLISRFDGNVSVYVIATLLVKVCDHIALARH